MGLVGRITMGDYNISPQIVAMDQLEVYIHSLTVKYSSGNQAKYEASEGLLHVRRTYITYI